MMPIRSALLRLDSSSGRLRLAAARAVAPHWAAVAALALFLVAGLAILDDYGASVDEVWQRDIALANLAYVGGQVDTLHADHDRLYGVAFELPLLLAERVFGVENDRRAVYILRHLAIHLFFLIGGIAAYLLVRRLSGGELLALLTMLIFLLHPRLHAHSFFNSKDIPFLALFMIALFLAHRAFKRDSVAAFVLLGATVGALMNLRVMGVVLLAAVPSMRTLDFAFASNGADRKRILLTAGAFTLAGALSTFISLPYFWSDPAGRAVDWWAISSAHPSVPSELFSGTIYPSVDFPAEYLPVWFSITAPLFALTLGLAGAATVAVNGAGAPRRALRNTRLRFWTLALGCFALPALAVVLLDANIYNGWRQVYFLWAPFSLLAAYGLGWLGSSLGRARLRAAVYGAVGAGIVATVISMALLHPNEQIFFNALVDRTTPERLRTQYVMNYWGHPTRQALEWLLDKHPFSDLNANAPGPIDEHLIRENTRILPDASRARLSWIPYLDAFMIRSGAGERSDLALRRLKVYDNTMLTIERKDDLRAVYDAALLGELILDSVFDVYRVDDELIYVKEPCAASYVVNRIFAARVFPANLDDLPKRRRAQGYEPVSVKFERNGALFDDKCVAAVSLPGYPIEGIEVIEWPELLAQEEEARDAMRRAMQEGQPRERSVYDVYLSAGEVVYINDSCDLAGTDDKFFLHITPERADDLSVERRRIGFDNLDFDFFSNGALLDDKCVAAVSLPEYPIASIQTGQFVSGEGKVWSAEFAVRETLLPSQ